MSFEQQLKDLGPQLDSLDRRVTDLRQDVSTILEIQRATTAALAELSAKVAKDPDPDPPPTDGSTNVRLIQEFSGDRDPVSVAEFNARMDSGGEDGQYQHNWVRYAYDGLSALRMRQWAPVMHADGRLSYSFLARHPGADHGQVILQHMKRGNPDRLPEGFLLRPHVRYQYQWSVRWDGTAWPASWVQLFQCYGMHGAGNQSDGRKNQIAVFAKNGFIELVTHDRAGQATQMKQPIRLLTNIWYTFALEFRASGEETDFCRLWQLSSDKREELDHHLGPIGTGKMTHGDDGYLQPSVGFYASSGVKVRGSIKNISLSRVLG